MESIRLENVSLWRRTQEEFSYDLKKTLFSILEGKFNRPVKRLVIDTIDLVVNEGEKIGIIGANGSGKSTLLKLICGILQPTSGSIKVSGNIAPLIELGAGFETEISVKDNIFLYGIFLGFSKAEMAKRVSEILEFSELQDFEQLPLKALSSGMVARLGFAIATNVEPDILILDEVLSVGDESFKQKCNHRLKKLWSSKTTILVVSHDLQFIRKNCDQAICLSAGKKLFSGKADDVIEQYLNFIN